MDCPGNGTRSPLDYSGGRMGGCSFVVVLVVVVDVRVDRLRKDMPLPADLII